jgi:hypothetical protein
VDSPFMQTFTDGPFSVYFNPTLQTLPSGAFILDDGQLPGREEANPEDNGNTLVVLDTSTPVYIGKTVLGRQFGPTILAPFAHVVLLGEAGYIDGCVIAKSFTTRDGRDTIFDDSQLQMHGDCYRGPLCPPGVSTMTTTTTLTAAATTIPVVPPTMTITAPRTTTTTTTPMASTTTAGKKKKHPKCLYLWLAGAVGAAISAGLAIPLIVDAAKKKPAAPAPPPAKPPPANPCVPANPGAPGHVLYGQEYEPDQAMSDSEDYKMGQEFGRAWAYPILFSFAVLLVLFSFAVMKIRRRASRNYTSFGRSRSQQPEEIEAFDVPGFE